MFKLNSIYKHQNCLDICFKVEEIKEKENGDIHLLGLWLNQHYDMLIICSDDIIVTKERIHQWRILNDDNKNPVGGTGIHHL